MMSVNLTNANAILSPHAIRNPKRTISFLFKEAILLCTLFGPICTLEVGLLEVIRQYDSCNTGELDRHAQHQQPCPYSTSLGCRRQPSLACHAWNHGKSPKSSPLSQQCRFHCHTWSAGESHYCVNSNGFMKFGTHTNEESDEYQQKWLPLSDFVGLCSKYIAIPYGSMAFILKNPSFQLTRCF